VNSTGWASCVGVNSAGELGDGTTTDRSSPVAVIGLGDTVKQMAKSWRDGVNCAVLDRGEAKCWGTNGYGLTPVALPGPNNYEYIGVGYSHMCAIRWPNFEVWCWGDAGAGRLGNNATAGDFADPQPVLFG